MKYGTLQGITSPKTNIQNDGFRKGGLRLKKGPFLVYVRSSSGGVWQSYSPWRSLFQMIFLDQGGSLPVDGRVMPFFSLQIEV